MIFPPVAARPYIRRLELGVVRPYNTCWSGLQKVADASLGFDGLRYVGVGVQQITPEDVASWPPQDLEINGPPIHFNCNGTITIWDESVHELFGPLDLEFDEKVRGLITFGG